MEYLELFLIVSTFGFQKSSLCETIKIDKLFQLGLDDFFLASKLQSNQIAVCNRFFQNKQKVFLPCQVLIYEDFEIDPF